MGFFKKRVFFFCWVFVFLFLSNLAHADFCPRLVKYFFSHEHSNALVNDYFNHSLDFSSVSSFILMQTPEGRRLIGQVGVAKGIDGLDAHSLIKLINTNLNDPLLKDVSRRIAAIHLSLSEHQIQKNLSNSPYHISADEAKFLREHSSTLNLAQPFHLPEFPETLRHAESSPNPQMIRLFDQRIVDPRETPEIAEFKIRGKNVIIQGTRYENVAKTPIVLLHGLLESSRLWRDTARKLHSLGYDVWMFNLRGHGRAGHRSIVTNNDYSVLSMAQEDLPAILEHVNSVTGKKCALFGHSMGGFLTRAAEEQYIMAQAEFGSPADFKFPPKLLKLMAPIVKRLTEELNKTTPLFFAPRRAPTDPDPIGIARHIENITKTFVDPLLSKLLDSSIVNSKNLTAYEYSILREKVVSKLHSHLLHEFANAMSSGDGSRVFFDDSHLRDIPKLVVIANLDSLAHPLHTLSDAWDKSSNREIWTASFLGTGHVDLVYGELAAQKLAALLHQFLLDPRGLGPAGSLNIIPR